MSETDKMLKIINENCKKKQAARERARIKKEEKEKRVSRMEITFLVIALIGLIVAFGISNEKRVKKCMEDGHSENFCRYAGE